jgi:hypothetical protein
MRLGKQWKRQMLSFHGVGPIPSQHVSTMLWHRMQRAMQ